MSQPEQVSVRAGFLRKAALELADSHDNLLQSVKNFLELTARGMNPSLKEPSTEEWVQAVTYAQKVVHIAEGGSL